MKKTILFLAIAMSCYCSYAQVYDTGNNVGIGIPNPTAKFQIETAGNTDPNGLAANSNIDGMIIGSNGYGQSAISSRQYDAVNQPAAGDTQFLNLFYNGSTYNWYERMRISANGNVGIGTASPNAPLEILTSSNHLVQFSNSASGSANDYLTTIGWKTNQFAIQPQQVNVGYVNTLINPSGGNVLIGQATQGNSSYKLDIKGSVRANEIVVNTSGADFVFEKEYSLPKLSDVKTYIDKNQHLPEIPSAKEMEVNGLELGEMNKKLLQKVEELTLYLIEQQKINKSLQRQINNLKRTHSHL